LQIADVNDVIESALGGLPVTTTVEGRNRFTVNVRYAQDFRSSLQAVRDVVVALPSGMSQPATLDPMGGTTANAPRSAPAQIPLSAIADVSITSGPPMIRDEAGLLVGYVYVDIDANRDVGTYVDDAKAAVEQARRNNELTIPPGYYMKWTGQYELLADMQERMKILIPIALLITIVLLYLQFKSFTEVLIVLLSVPFALVGSVWALWLLDYNLSTAVWVGVIALVGLAAQTGIVMIVYIDHAYERRRREGRINSLEDIIEAHAEGTIQRVRPKLMTVATMLCGLVPLLWAQGSGADVMKRIAAPMVGGLITSAFLTLEIIPVIYTYWRNEQLLWFKLETLSLGLLRILRIFVLTLQIASVLAIFALMARLYLAAPPPVILLLPTLAGGVAALALITYAFFRRRAGRLVAQAEASLTNQRLEGSTA
jgi:Cu(I)/Ag(I) efflux system membrane protein CusA/SilA